MHRALLFAAPALALQLAAVSDADWNTRYGAVGRLACPADPAAAVARLRSARVAVFGVGGVGSWAAESLVRSGVGAVTLVDLDDICASNIGRQLHALTTTVGQLKVDVMAERLAAINPGCAVATRADFVDADNAAELVAGYDFVLDAVDQLHDKAALVAACAAAGVPLVVSGSAGGRLDPTRITSGDLTATQRDALLSNLRKTVRKQRGDDQALPFHKAVPPWHVQCVYSDERPVPSADGGGGGGMRACDAFGTASFVTGAMGLAAASVAVKALAQGTARPPALPAARPVPVEGDR